MYQNFCKFGHFLIGPIIMDFRKLFIPTNWILQYFYLQSKILYSDEMSSFKTHVPNKKVKKDQSTQYSAIVGMAWFGKFKFI